VQNKYFGDIHDFYKYYFLKEITKDYSLGIHWCLYPNEMEKNEGNYPLTLKEKDIDPELYELLLENRHKGVKYIKPYFKKNLPKKTEYYEEELKNDIENNVYEEKAIDKLKNKDIIFFDPDTGIEVSGMKKNEKYKYVTYQLLVEFWRRGKSLIIYQHIRIDNEKTYEWLVKKVRKLYDAINQEANVILVKTKKVYYICFIQGDKHYIILDELARLNQKEIYTIENWEGTGDIMC